MKRKPIPKPTAQATTDSKTYALGYMPALDGLRAISILLVLCFHNMGPLTHRWGLLFNGWIGVDVFFVISGFLITSILLNEARDNGGVFSLRRFYMRRILRIGPAYYTFLAIVFLWFYWHGWRDFKPFICAFFYLTNFDMAFQWRLIPLQVGLDHLWSLAMEEQFYLFWPLTLKVFRRNATLFAILMILAVYFWRIKLINAGVPLIRLTAAFDTKIDAIIFGVLAALLLVREAIYKSAKKLLTHDVVQVGLFVLMFVLFFFIGHPKDGGKSGQLFFWGWKMPLTLVVITLNTLSIVLSPKGPVSRILSRPVMVAIGKGSYSIYLWHVFAHQIFQHHYSDLVETQPFIMEMLNYIVIFALAALSYLGIEQPFLRLKSRFAATHKTHPQK